MRVQLLTHVYTASINIHLIQTLLDLGADVSSTDAQGENGRGGEGGERGGAGRVESDSMVREKYIIALRRSAIAPLSTSSTWCISDILVNSAAQSSSGRNHGRWSRKGSLPPGVSRRVVCPAGYFSSCDLTRLPASIPLALGVSP